MSKPGMNFSSPAAYQRWLAYGHMHGDFEKSPGNTPVSIKGKAKKVDHSPAKHQRLAEAMAKSR